MTNLITSFETYCLKLPYKQAISFKSVKEAFGQYVILRLVTQDGTEGIAESVARPEQSGEDARSIAYNLNTFFKDRLLNADPQQHLALLQKCNQIKLCPTEKALIDNALWDLRGKLAGQPVWKLLGGGPIKPIPLTWIAHGNTTDAMISEACKKAQQGYKGLKLKIWKRSQEDVRMVREVRKSVGDDVMIYVDANGSYTETEARTILADLPEHNVALIEEPCSFTDPRRQAELARDLPISLLGDQSCANLESVFNLISFRAVGAVSIKLRRTGLTESLKIASLCEAAGIPAVIGTDSESRIGAMVRFHLRSAIPSLAPWPVETHFFEKLQDDPFAGDFLVENCQAMATDLPGFGATLDAEKLQRYAIRP
jgi:L-alanine-DL-glutamate epimerase-like enolase superfamily enzyme